MGMCWSWLCLLSLLTASLSTNPPCPSDGEASSPDGDCLMRRLMGGSGGLPPAKRCAHLKKESKPYWRMAQYHWTERSQPTVVPPEADLTHAYSVLRMISTEPTGSEASLLATSVGTTSMLTRATSGTDVRNRPRQERTPSKPASPSFGLDSNSDSDSDSEEDSGILEWFYKGRWRRKRRSSSDQSPKYNTRAAFQQPRLVMER